MEKIKIETTQNVFIEYELASVGDRILATIIDGIIVWAYIILWIFLLIQIGDNGGFDGDTDVLWVVLFVLVGLPYLLYDLVSEIFMNGQTIGKKQRNIKVIRLDGRQPNIGHYFLRWILRPIDMLFYGGFAVVVVSINGKGQRLGDLAAGTTVVKMRQNLSMERTLSIPDIDNMYVPTYLQVTLLTDNDINIIREVLRTFREQKNQELLTAMAQKIKNVLQIFDTNLPEVEFLQLIIKDYTYLAEQSE